MKNRDYAFADDVAELRESTRVWSITNEDKNQCYSAGAKLTRTAVRIELSREILELIEFVFI